jgi:hypothetical protein
MTLTTLITVNAIVGALVVYGIVMLLGHGIRTDRTAVRGATVQQLRRRETDRLAA